MGGGGGIFKTFLKISQVDSDETGPGSFLCACQALTGPNAYPNQPRNVISVGLEGRGATGRGPDTLGTCVFASVCAHNLDLLWLLSRTGHTI